MYRPPPRSTRTDQLFPQTTRFRSPVLAIGTRHHPLLPAETAARLDDWRFDIGWVNADQASGRQEEGCQFRPQVHRMMGALWDRRPGSTRAPACPQGASIVHVSAMPRRTRRSEEHTSELQSLMRISYAVFCF